MIKNKKEITYSDLSDEQKAMIGCALSGKNVLVNACIGSGKTASIQILCNELKGKRILYVTYSRALKDDAKTVIHNWWTDVMTCHGFAYRELKRIDVNAGQGDQIQKYLRVRPPMSKFYDVLIIDEYQDIDLEIAQMLMIIKESFPNIQIVAVGDMCQKIFDKSALDPYTFIQELLGDHEELSFSRSFRISKEFGDSVSRVWNRSINGVNKQQVARVMSLKDVKEYLAAQELGDILCLGAKKGVMNIVLNELEEKYPEKFNKNTVYANIKDDGEKANISPNEYAAIFTTYDSCKGLERNINVVFDYTNKYWDIRLNQSNTSGVILKNLFLVASTRGKRETIFVTSPGEELLTEKDLLNIKQEPTSYVRPFNISDMFTLKYKEDVEASFSLIRAKEIPRADTSEIKVKNCDGYIDLSPCIGNFVQVSFFHNYDIDDAIVYSKETHSELQLNQLETDATIEDKILYLTSYDTGQDRYYNQVSRPFIDEDSAEQIKDRLFTEFTSKEDVEVDCSLDLNYEGKVQFFSMNGRADVVKDDVVYELKFTSCLSHENFLQLACYLVALGKEKGILWNVRTNQMFEVEVPDKKRFFSSVVKTVTKEDLDIPIDMIFFEETADPLSTAEPEATSQPKTKKTRRVNKLGKAKKKRLLKKKKNHKKKRKCKKL